MAALRAQLAAAAAEPAEAAAQREAAERQHLVQSMQAVMAGVKQYQFEVYQNPEVGAGCGQGWFRPARWVASRLRGAA